MVGNSALFPICLENFTREFRGFRRGHNQKTQVAGCGEFRAFRDWHNESRLEQMY
jgi:hypothetical protein